MSDSPSHWLGKIFGSLANLAGAPGQIIRRNQAGTDWEADDPVALPEDAAAGDLFYLDGAGNLVRIPIATEGSTLKVVSGVPAWVSGTLDPATLALSGWFRGSYSGSTPWSGTASAGTSGSRSFNSGTSPAGAAVNGFTPASFDGTNHQLFSSDDLSLYISSSAYRVVMLIKTPASAAAPAGNIYDDPTILAHGGGNWGVVYNANGVSVFHYDGSYKTATKACAVNGWHMIDITYDGAADTLSISVDGGAPTVTSTVGDCGSLATDFYMGINHASGHRFTGQILELITATTTLAGTTAAQFKGYIDSRYAMSL